MAIAHHQPAAATAPAADDWLAALNAQQRQAVLHGTGEGAVPGPLLVIAGAGTGKTDTLAHRVAHLVRQGRRPAAHPAADVLPAGCGRTGEAGGARPAPARSAPAPARTSMTLPWAGTFHAVGARLLREYARRIGLDPAFTIHDRERRRGPARTRAPRARLRDHPQAVPGQGHLPRDLLARRQQRGAARRGARGGLSLVRAAGSAS